MNVFKIFFRRKNVQFRLKYYNNNRFKITIDNSKKIMNCFLDLYYSEEIYFQKCCLDILIDNIV